MLQRLEEFKGKTQALNVFECHDMCPSEQLNPE